jgi:hypothetical protein
MTSSDDVDTTLVPGLRLATGLVQGLILYLLIDASSRHVWPSTDPVLNRALFLAFSFVPLLLMQGAGLVRLPRLIAWAIAASVIALGLGAYSAWREQTGTPDSFAAGAIILAIFLAAGFFIAHALIVGGDMDRRFMATYPTHFDVAWKLALQLILTLFFTSAFWALLWLGAFLFQLIGLSFLKTLIGHSWFAVPATALMVAGGLHLTDMQPGLVRGMRTLVLALFSWLLPLMTVLAVGFLVALLATGLQPLWRTSHAAAQLLSAAACLIILINAMYQDGAREHAPVAGLRYSGIAAALALVPLVLLAAYAISLRVVQYGWTADRVIAAACALIAGFYAAGYAASIFLPQRPLQFIERWNFFAALLILGVLLALFSPLADPARIAVNSQVARLEAGRITAAKFDFNYLRTGSLRFGRAALERLTHSTDYATRIAALDAKKQTAMIVPARSQSVNPLATTARIAVYPKGKVVPQSFLKWDWTEFARRSVVTRCDASKGAGKRICEVVVSDLDGDGRDDILLLSEVGTSASYTGYLFQQSPDGRWEYTARLGYPHCDGDLDALRAGHVSLAPSLNRDIMIGGRRQTIHWENSAPVACPPGTASR